MSKIDTSNIKRLTKEKISYTIYEREEKMKKQKLIRFAIVIAIFSVFIGGTFTVNALTDNKIVDTVTEKVKDVLKVKSNGKEYDASCKKESDGSITCTLPEELTGKDTESVINFADGNMDNIDVEYKEENNEVEMNVTLNDTYK